jgi:hypothetical protein
MRSRRAPGARSPIAGAERSGRTGRACEPGERLRSRGRGGLAPRQIEFLFSPLASVERPGQHGSLRDEQHKEILCVDVDTAR